jgi:phage terminase large subunit
VEVKINTTITFEHLLECPTRLSIHVGGSRSGKSYGIVQFLIVQGIESKQDISIVRKTIPSLKRTNIRDFKDIMQSIGIWKEDNWNSTDRVYTMDNGSTFTFVNTDDPDKLRGYKSDILWLDEATEIDESSWFQMSIRTSGRMIVSFNPTCSPYHWLRKLEGGTTYVTTYKDNPWLPKEMVQSIEELQTKNEKLWKIYGKGEYAPNERAIYKFEIVDDFEAEFVAFGLDWGFNDKMSMVACYRNGDKLYVEELIYESKMTMTDLVNRLKNFGIEREEIWCDSSEPRSVEELYRAGFNAKAVKKGPDSIKFGIGVLQNFKIHIKKDSQNLIDEIYGYQYAQDKYGYTTDTPEGGNDHLMDAMRYVAMMKLSLKAQSRGTYAISIK